MGLRFEYPSEFERLWKAHPVGVKKPAFDAWKKLKLTADENSELLRYLVRRHKEDLKWIEGTYVPHLTTFLNQRRWEDEYKTVQSLPASHRPFEREEIRDVASREFVEQTLTDLKRQMGIRH